MLKRAHKGTFHKMSPKQLQRYINEFAGKHNVSDSDTLNQMWDTVARLVGRNLLLRDLVACNGFSNSARQVPVAQEGAGQGFRSGSLQVNVRVYHRYASGHVRIPSLLSFAMNCS